MRRVLICSIALLLLVGLAGCGQPETNGMLVDEIPEDLDELAEVVEDIPRGEVGGKVDQMVEHFEASGLDVGEVNAMFLLEGMTDAVWVEVEGDRADLYLRDDGELELYAPMHPELERIQEVFDSF